MDLERKGGRALVTGSSSGIGAGIARILAAKGATVVAHGRDEHRARQVAAELGGYGAKTFVVLGDPV